MQCPLAPRLLPFAEPRRVSLPCCNRALIKSCRLHSLLPRHRLANGRYPAAKIPSPSYPSPTPNKSTGGLLSHPAAALTPLSPVTRNACNNGLLTSIRLPRKETVRYGVSLDTQNPSTNTILLPLAKPTATRVSKSGLKPRGQEVSRETGFKTPEMTSA